MTEVTITPFDNEISILYKWVRYFNIPVKLIIISTEIKVNYEKTIYTNGVEKIQNLIQYGYNLSRIHGELSDKLELEYIIMLYALLSIQNKMLLSNIINEINQLYENLDIHDRIKDEIELKLILDDWKNNITADLKNNLLDLDDLEAIHNELSRYQEILVSPIKVDHVIIKAVPVLKSTNKPPQLADEMDLFDKSIPSNDIPFIRYNRRPNGKKNELFKLYRGKTVEEMPNYDIIIPNTSQSNNINTFYMTIWSGKGTLYKTTKESYMIGKYNIDDNILTVKTPIEEGIDQNTIISKIEKSFPITINNVTETGISGEFYLYDLDINYIYLVDMIINTELMSSYIFVKETNNSYAEKQQLKIYYKSFSGFVEEEEKITEGYIVNPSSVSISLTQSYAHGGEIITTQSPTGPIKYRLTHNLPYVRVKITQAESIKVANQFSKIFSRLMQFYKAEKANTERLFISFIPEINSLITKPFTTLNKSGGRKGTDSKIERLKETAPDLFVNGYARKCQCILQPISIPPEEIEAWKNKTFLYKEIMKERQVMPFPPINPKWTFVCPNDSAPFPGVKFNTNLSNKDIYPCVPCCFKDNQIDPNVNSNYNKCYREKSLKKQKLLIKDKQKIKTDKILPPGRHGFLPKSIFDLLSKYSDKSVDVIRIGVPNSVNSILHSVSIAIRDTSYISLQTYKEKEDYVSNIRNIISSKTLPNLIKQEMYDFTDDEIIEQLSNPKNFLDPNLFYRAIEESYNINIYVFSPSKKKDISSLGSLEMPRFKLFHSRSPRPKRTAVLLFRTWGAKSDFLNYPQCELIVDRDDNNNKTVTNFGLDMNILLQNTMATIKRNITWELTPQKVKPTKIIARDNIYSRENYFTMLGKLPTQQIVDGYGKARAFIFPSENENITVIIPSSQPENLPTGNITRANVNTVVSIFGKPGSITKNNNMTDGLWYKVLDLNYGIYIPIISTEQYIDIEIGPNNPLVERGKQVVQRIRKIRKDLEYIIQIILWLYLLSKMDIKSFVTQYIFIGKDYVEDSSTVYNLSGLNRKFPIVESVDEGISQLILLVPTLFKENRLYLYSQKFFDGLFYHLEKYDKERMPKNNKIPTVINIYDLSEEDFTHQRHVAIFTDEKDMKTWINSLDKLSFKNIIIEDHLNISNALRTEPYIYMAPTGNIYLIQNVIGGSQKRALNVAYNWYLHKINTGHRTLKFNTDIPVNVVYGISPALAPIIIENNAGKSTQYLQILLYGSDQYSAMLPLL